MQEKYRILAAFRLAYSSNRKFLSGLATYVKRHRNWRVTVADSFQDFTPELCETVLREGYDAIITVSPHGDQARKLLAAIPTPVALLGTGGETLPTRTGKTIYISSNDSEIGRVAARHFLELGKFASYGYLDINERLKWNELRWTGFRDELQRHRIRATHIRSPFPTGSVEDARRIRRVLTEMPKPIALFAAYDNRALSALSLCNTPEMSVPRQISVIGVDDDEVLCDFSSPTLSSISIGNERKGESAAEAMEGILSGSSMKASQTIVLSQSKIVERGSTAKAIRGARLVEKARVFIRENAAKGLGVNDIAIHLGVSRTLAERYFRHYARTTILCEINKIRLARLKRLLKTETLSTADVARECGFPTTSYAMRFFKRLSGMTMTEYRRSLR